jgi:hypothetical protein
MMVSGGHEYEEKRYLNSSMYLSLSLPALGGLQCPAGQPRLGRSSCVARAAESALQILRHATQRHAQRLGQRRPPHQLVHCIQAPLYRGHIAEGPAQPCAQQSPAACTSSDSAVLPFVFD